MNEHRTIVWPVSGLEKVFADATPPGAAPNSIELFAAAGECEVAQIAVRATEEDMFVYQPEIAPLQGDGQQIDAAHISSRFVDLVPVRCQSQGIAKEDLIRAAPDFFPDPLCLEESMIIPAGQTRTIWLCFYTPQDTSPGVYTGHIKVLTSGGNDTHVGAAGVIAVKHTVWPIRLPKHIPFALTLWVWPALLAQYHCVQLYSEAFWELIKRYAVEMAAHRQDTIFTTILGADSLIDITRTGEGEYQFDFSNFDRWVNLFLEAGFVRIEGSHLYDDGIKWVRIWDQNLGKTQIMSMSGMGHSGKVSDFTRNKQYMEVISALMKALRSHVTEAGWENQYVQHIFDEPSPEQRQPFIDLVKLVRDIWPNIVLVDAANDYPAVRDMVDIVVPLTQSKLASSDLSQSDKLGKTYWAYTCNHPRGRYANVYLDQPLLQTRILPWICWRYGFSGFLYYALGYWEFQPVMDRHKFDPHTGQLGQSIALYDPWLDPCQNATWRCPPGSWGFVYPPRDPWSLDPRIIAPNLVENADRVHEGQPTNKADATPAGHPDKFKVHPGIVSSIRWEQLREGIEDYGLLCLLDDLINQASKSVAHQDIAQECRQKRDTLIQSIAPDWENYTRNASDIESARHDVAQMIMALQ